MKAIRTQIYHVIQGNSKKYLADTMSLMEVANDFVDNESRHCKFGKFVLINIRK